MADPLIIYPLFLTYKWNLTVPYQQQIAVEINPLVQQAAKFPYTVFWGQKLLLLFRNLIFLFLVQEVVRPHPQNKWSLWISAEALVIICGAHTNYYKTYAIGKLVRFKSIWMYSQIHKMKSEWMYCRKSWLVWNWSWNLDCTGWCIDKC